MPLMELTLDRSGVKVNFLDLCVLLCFLNEVRWAFIFLNRVLGIDVASYHDEGALIWPILDYIFCFLVLFILYVEMVLFLQSILCFLFLQISYWLAYLNDAIPAFQIFISILSCFSLGWFMQSIVFTKTNHILSLFFFLCKWNYFLKKIKCKQLFIAEDAIEKLNLHFLRNAHNSFSLIKEWVGTSDCTFIWDTNYNASSMVF